jgi:hypothetical protein
LTKNRLRSRLPRAEAAGNFFAGAASITIILP